VFQSRGVLQARRGCRNNIAGAIAHDIVRRGGTFEDFEAWDRSNKPPLASDKPTALKVWWAWALRKEQRRTLRQPVKLDGGTRPRRSGGIDALSRP
jgi:hypothetical protein